MQLKECIHCYIGCEAEFIGYYNKDRFTNTLTGFDIEYIKAGNVYESVKPILRRLESITEDHLIELWAIIGGCPDLFYIGGVDLLKGLKYGDWDDSGLFLDLYTLTQMINKMRSLGYDCDGLTESGQALDAETLKQS